MAKRALGLGQKSKEKKRKLEEKQATDSRDATPGADQLSVEMDENADLDNEFSQLKGLWKTYFASDRESEMVLNGIVHECDRLLRQSSEDAAVKASLSGEFHSIYALALSELTIFKAGEDGDSKDEKLVKGFFDNALERCELGQSSFPDSALLNLVKAKIIIQRIPLEYISQLNVKSTGKRFDVDLDDQLEIAKKNFNIYDDDLQLSSEVLQMLDDLLDIVENFGHEDDIDEGLDSDDEEELEKIELSPSHPLFKLQKSVPENYKWLREQMIQLLQHIKEKDSKLYHDTARSIGHLYLKFAEEPSSEFMRLQYGDEEEDPKKQSASKDCINAQRNALKYTKEALKYLEKGKISDEPETWVEVAEAYISLGNLYDYQSKDQEHAYSVAETILKKANKASHGKFQDILDNLLDKE
ncbi:hypothetical protein HG535_0F05490 [Zygotorulaspora mrakii]|uniref:Enhancer of translation termination 1 n=1 Tax=Zygotorulaspora mrakii TaxID=42260 RepID=A0A7H9B645_ZYGMR|nr:uncharacterized protein HG535_0F05490 [Zygotorulaspora mrakii]QLG74037.1 hypothetical protein HG535_0F05490 [Zygotorulaspora mrakii]